MRALRLRLVVAVLGAVGLLRLAEAAEPGKVAVRPQDNGAALENPGMGWVFHHYDNSPRNYGAKLAPSDTVDDFPGLTVVYLRIAWSYLEPEEGRFNWSILDTPAQRWIAKGKQIALRITTSESNIPYATPAWVQKAGAKGYNFNRGKIDPNGRFWEPDYGDPIYLEKLDRFLAALGARYDNNPEVAFVDVGTFGVWGEGHNMASTRKNYPPEVLIKHVELHLKHFKKTLLAANDDFLLTENGDRALDYSFQHGLTLRDDSILVRGGKNAYFHAQQAQAIWPRLPVVLESEHYGPSKKGGYWQDGSLYLQALEDYHASYASIHWWPREFLEENRDLIARMNRRLGYRLQLAEASLPEKASREGGLSWATAWRNAGVAPCLPGGYPALTLKDNAGGIAAVLVDPGLDVRSLPVAAPGQAETKSHAITSALPLALTAGAYDVYVSVGTITGTPRIALPLDGGDSQRRYRIGKIEITEN